MALGAFVWPTRYRYDHIKLNASDLPVRIDRLTGKTEILFPQGWRASGPAGETTDRDQELPAKDVAKLIGQARFATRLAYSSSYDSLEVEVYNGSDWTISEITVLVTVLNANKSQILSRSYRLSSEYGGNSTPQSSTKFKASLGFELAPDQTWSVSITNAKGKRG